jgi:hypothetical protein
MTGLAGWQNFYVIVGSSAGALIGLQFVVLTLIAERPITGANIAQANAAFSTPTIIHFGTALLLSALLCAPWNGIVSAAIVWGLIGLCGLVYSAIVSRRMRAQTIYRPVLEDWTFHVLLPSAAYATLIATAYEAQSHAREALFAVAAAALSLLFVGIHNAWDGVTYHIFNRKPVEDKRER